MIIRRTTPEENARAAELFAICFEFAMTPGTVAPGSEPGRQRWAAFREDGEMMSTLLITDFSIGFDGTPCKMAGFGGVATLPPYRRKGCIRSCLQKVLPELYENGYLFSYLFPFSTGYYQQFGYEHCVQLCTATVDLLQLKLPRDNGHFRLAEAKAPLVDAIRQVDSHWERRYNMMVQHTDRSYDWARKADPPVRQGFTYVWYDADGTPKAYTTFQPDSQGNLSCKRFCFADKAGFQGLMQVFKSVSANHRYATFSMPASAVMRYLLPEWQLDAVRWKIQSGGMVRVINAEAVLNRAVCRGSGSVTLELLDPMIPQNSGCFTVSFDEGKVTSVLRTQAAADAVLSIGTFSALICGVCDWEEALTWMDGIQVNRANPCLCRLFYQKPMMITDLF